MVDYPRFHYAFPVPDIEKARAFYGGVFGCREGRKTAKWVDFDFFGHQLVTHLDPNCANNVITNSVDGDAVPSRHFGVILPWNEWEELKEKLEKQHIEFTIPPRIRFEGKAGEQATMFLKDPFGNALEFKSFKDESLLFESEEQLDAYA